MDELREKIAEIINDWPLVIDGEDDDQGFQIADKILALPEFEALKLVGIMKYEGSR